MIDLEATPPRVIDRVVVGDAPEGLAISPKGNLAAVVVRNARDPVLAGETFDDQPSPVGYHYPLQAGPRLAGVRERLAPVDLPDRARGIGGGVLERLAAPVIDQPVTGVSIDQLTPVPAGSGISVMRPPSLITPILEALCSVNHMAPSGPAVIPCGRAPRLGSSKRRI